MSILIIPGGLHNPEKRAEFVQNVIKKLNRSIVYYERSLDGRREEKDRQYWDNLYQKTSDEVENSLRAIGLKVDWPGLFPSLTLPDGTSEHDIERAVNAIFQNKKQQIRTCTT